MGEGREAPYVLPNECRLIHTGIQGDVIGNKKAIEKIVRLIYGNGQDGLLWKVNILLLRNQWIDKGASIIIGLVASVAGSLLTLYFTGAFN